MDKRISELRRLGVIHGDVLDSPPDDPALEVVDCRLVFALGPFEDGTPGLFLRARLGIQGYLEEVNTTSECPTRRANTLITTLPMIERERRGTARRGVLAKLDVKSAFPSSNSNDYLASNQQSDFSKSEA